MQKVQIYQIVDTTSEGIIYTFIAPNNIVANRQFRQFITNPKWKDSIVPEDFVLCEVVNVDIMESFSDFEKHEDDGSIAVLSAGDDWVVQEDVEDEA